MSRDQLVRLLHLTRVFVRDQGVLVAVNAEGRQDLRSMLQPDLRSGSENAPENAVTRHLRRYQVYTWSVKVMNIVDRGKHFFLHKSGLGFRVSDVEKKSWHEAVRGWSTMVQQTGCAQ